CRSSAAQRRNGNRSMSDDIPILRLGPNLMVTLQGNLEDTTVEHIERAVTHEVARTRATGLLIDVSGLSIVDSFVARVIARLVAVVRLLGARSTRAGIQLAVAITLVALGVPMSLVRTALTAEPGIADVEQVMRDGYTTGDSLGLGLPGSRRLVDEFSIDSAVGRGTTVVIAQWSR